MLTFITWFHFFISLSLLDVLSSQGVGIAADALQRAQEHVMRKSVISQVPPLGKIALHILGSAALLTMMISSFSGRAGGVGQDGGGGPGCAAPHLEGCAMLAKQDIPMISSNAGGPDERRGLADWESCRDCQACHQ